METRGATNPLKWTEVGPKYFRRFAIEITPPALNKKSASGAKCNGADCKPAIVAKI